MKNTKFYRYFHNKFLKPVLHFLKIGISPEKITQAIISGIVIGLSPLYGLTTILCAILSFVFKLNMAIIQLANYLVWPLQIMLILPFIRLGEEIFNAAPLPFSVNELWMMFKDDWIEAMKSLGFSVVYGTVAWLIIVLPLSVLLYFIILKMLKLKNKQLKEANEKN